MSSRPHPHARAARFVIATLVAFATSIATAPATATATTTAVTATATTRASTADAALQSPASLVAAAREAAAAHAGPGAEFDVRAPDARLRLPACAQPLAARVAPGTRSPTQLAVEVACARPAWRHYVSVRVRALETVVVAARPIARGQAVTADDVTVATRELDALSTGFFRTGAAAVGRVAQRSIGAGEVLAPAVLRAPALVRRGQQVTLVATGGPVQVAVGAVALADGALADRVRVRNAATGRLVEGVVRSPDVVEVRLP